MKCSCRECHTEGEIVPSTDLICVPCYNKKQIEVGKLQEQIEHGGELLKSANNDVKRLQEYADKLEAERDKLEKLLMFLRIIHGGQNVTQINQLITEHPKYGQWLSFEDVGNFDIWLIGEAMKMLEKTK